MVFLYVNVWMHLPHYSVFVHFQVVSYIGREGSAVKANAAASLCPAWDISKAFGRLQTKYPRLDRYITQSVINLFIRYVVTNYYLVSNCQSSDSALQQWFSNGLFLLLQTTTKSTSLVKHARSSFQGWKSHPSRGTHGGDCPFGWVQRPPTLLPGEQPHAVLLWEQDTLPGAECTWRLPVLEREHPSRPQRHHPQLCLVHHSVRKPCGWVGHEMGIFVLIS